MIKRLLVIIAAGIGLTATAAAGDHYDLGGSTFSIPAGWKQINKVDERLTFGAPDGRQQATISLMHFNAKPSFEDFKKLCSLRYDTEKKGLDDVFLQPDNPEPFEKGGEFGMFFSGGEKGAARIFSGFLSLQGQELITIYVEGIKVDPKTHLESFKIFASSLKQR